MATEHKSKAADHHHSLAIGGLAHALAGGHIDQATHDKAVASATKAINDGKAARAKNQNNLKKVQQTAPPAPLFGSLAPVPMPAKPPLQWNGK